MYRLFFIVSVCMNFVLSAVVAYIDIAAQRDLDDANLRAHIADQRRKDAEFSKAVADAISRDLLMQLRQIESGRLRHTIAHRPR